jgi:hypothetical protein
VHGRLDGRWYPYDRHHTDHDDTVSAYVIADETALMHLHRDAYMHRVLV